MTANIFINGIVGGSFWDESQEDTGTTLADVRRQYNSFSNPTKVNVFINSPGGSVDVGFSIHDYLRSLGIPVTTIGEGQVYSIATVILLAGDTRMLSENSRFLIHNPTPSMGVWGDANDFEEMAELLRAEEDRIIDFYARKTGQSADQLREWMDAETIFSFDEAKNAGFVDEMYQTLAAVAYVRPNSKSDQMNEEHKGLIAQIKSLLNGTKNQADEGGDQNQPEKPTPEMETKEEAVNVNELTAKIEELEAKLAEKEQEAATEQAKAEELQNQISTQNELITQIQNKVAELEAMPVVPAQKSNQMVVKEEAQPHPLDGYAAHLVNKYGGRRK